MPPYSRASSLTTLPLGQPPTPTTPAHTNSTCSTTTVTQSLAEYVKGDVHTNGIEPLWSMLKRAHKSTFHKLSPKRLDRYVQEFASRRNLRDAGTIDIMGSVATGMRGKHLRRFQSMKPRCVLSV